MNEVCEAFAQKDQVGVTMGPPIYDKQTETVDDDKTVLSDIARSCTQAIDPSYFGKKKTMEERTNWIIPAAAGATCPKVYT